jgi:transaldolase
LSRAARKTCSSCFSRSRIDANVDPQLPESSPLFGRVAIAGAQVAYRCYQTKFVGHEWERLHAHGANAQRLLWASTGTENPAYSDVLYVSQLVGPNVINTMPEKTLRAFADHGEVTRTLDAHPAAAQQTLADVRHAGIDLEAVTAELEREGVKAFCDSYQQLLHCNRGEARRADFHRPTAG